MISPDGSWRIEDRALYGGIRQDLTSMARRYSVLRNLNPFKKNALQKDTGYRQLNSTAIGADIWNGIDAQFSGGTQKIVVIAGTEAYVFDPTTRTFTAQSQTFANVRPSLTMFQNNVVLFNGSQQKRYDGTSWASLSGSPPAGKYSAVHANRLVVSGEAANPYRFYYGGVRDYDSWNVGNDYVIVTAGQGEEVLNVASFGAFLVVQTLHNTILYVQNANNPGDWDRTDISGRIGITCASSYCELADAPLPMAFFWTTEGPFMMMRLSSGRPVLKELWPPIKDMVEGRTPEFQTEGIESVNFNRVTCGYQPSIGQVCFGVTKVGSSENNCLLRFDLRSLVAYALGELDAPVVSVRDNTITNIFPCDCLFPVQVSVTTGLPSTTGKIRLMGGRDGYVNELDVPERYNDDNGTIIPFYLARSGYNGADEGFGIRVKVADQVRVNASQDGGYMLQCNVSADGNQQLADTELDLDAGLGLWGDGGIWTDDPTVGKWNAASIQEAKGGIGVQGRTFTVELWDDGAIDGAFEMDMIALEGQFYGEE